MNKSFSESEIKALKGWFKKGSFILFFLLLNQYAQSQVCDSSLWNHVYHSYRLKVNNQCTTITGKVDHLIYEADGDIHIRLNLDAQYKFMLNSTNNSDQYGDLVLEPICATSVTQSDAVASCQNFKNTVYIPNVGEYVEVTGSYVTDDDHGWNEIHPVSNISIINGIENENPDTASINSLIVFPNPASVFVNFKFVNHPTSVIYINIMDEIGRNAGQYQLFETNSLRVNTTYLPAGNYYFNVIQNDKVIRSGKFIVIKG